MKDAQLKHLTLEIVAGSPRQVFAAFMLDRRGRGLSSKTLSFYQDELELFLHFLDGQGVNQLSELTPETIRLYLLHLSERRNGGGCHAAYRCIRALLRWAWDEYDLPGRNPITRVSAPKRRTDVLPGVSLVDVQALIGVCKNDATALRDKAIILTLLETGARAGELCAWNIADFDAHSGALTIRHGKGDKRRVVFVEKATRRAIAAYLRMRRFAQPCDPLFATRDGERFSVAGLRQVLRRRAAQAGIPTPGLHDFRRGFALNMLRAGVDVYSLQRLMGHADLSVLRRYLAQDDDDLRQAHAKGSPVERMLRG
ncbi:MAG: tyrosine-type recombinase/integrase [Anaerolineales bacterium]|nr:tyrosine-type recombinase/integrase [Anaerolineales bacterium]